ncbi:ABC transporter permease [Tersicoccus solisilvae]|uniref:ABC transporter permease n=1 Tax=Tersicoccus solisilvae TaxID=1882339 RepID=A0ABQ1PJS0_9MICC|nr:ABC transporter permease [Tersicoccus solisilvae]GGC98188.1 ABC transporter permease [Tersicoccus solisilvae]
MLTVTLSQLKSQPRRFTAVVLAVAIAVAFVCAALLFGDSSRATLRTTVGEAYAKADLVVSAGDDAPLSDAAVTAAARTDGVAEAFAPRQTLATAAAGDRVFRPLVSAAPPAQLSTDTLTAGSAPAGPDGVTVDADTATRQHLAVGDRFTLAPLDPGASSGSARKPVTVTVSGITAPSQSPQRAGMPLVSAPPAVLSRLSADALPASEIQVALAPGADRGTVATALHRAAAGAGIADPVVATADERVEAQVARFTGGERVLTTVLLSFAAIAVLVSILVVGNTYAVLIAQRIRDLALLRCVGATRAQIRRSVLAEGAVVGAVASVAGVGLALGLLSGLRAWLRTQPDAVPFELGVSPIAIVLPLVVGLALTLVATWRPASAATRVKPLAALRPSAEESGQRLGSRFRLVGGLVLLVGGTVLMIGGAAISQVLIALPGGMLSFVGLLMLVPFFLPRVAAAVGRLVGGSSVPGRLAALNAVRNPRRTATTATALLLGVTLVALMMTGAQTARQSLGDAIAQAYPVDVGVDVTDEGQARQVEAALRSAEAVRATTTLRPTGVDTPAGPAYQATPQDVADVVDDRSLTLRDGVALVPAGYDGDTLTLTGRGGISVTVPVVRSRSSSFPVVVTPATAARVLRDGPATGPALSGNAAPLVWSALAEGADAAAVSALRDDVAATAGIDVSQVGGGALQRLAFNQILDVLLWVVTGLLGVAVLIALIGVANTLSLSVLERTRENALLRALGLTRGQLRWMLVLEALLLAGVAAALGLVAGVGYGWAGAQSVLGALGPVSPAVPWGQLAAVLLVALVAGLLASVLPARRATRLSPVQGLATV